MRDATAETRQPKQKGHCGSRHNGPSPDGQEIVEHACLGSDRDGHGVHDCGDHQWTTAEESRRAS